jgi:methyl-accepting chemotaxis protein
VAGLVVLIYATCVGIAWAVQARSADELQRLEREGFANVVRLRTAQVVMYLDTQTEEMRFWAQNRIMRQALIDFSAAWGELGDDAQTILQRLYITENPYPTGEKDNLERGDDSSKYSDVHQSYHYFLRSFLLHRGIYDVFLFNTDGDLVYTSFKELDYATNLVRGKYRDTDLGGAFREARDNPYPSYVAMFDFEKYAPSHGEPAMFIASPVLADDGTLLGVLAFQLPPDRFNLIVRSMGLRRTSKTFLVGPDLRLRSRTPHTETAEMLDTAVETEAARRALAGEEGQILTLDYLGVPVISTFAPARFENIEWGLLAEMDESEYLGPSLAIRRYAVSAGLAVATLASLFVILLALRRSRSSA